MVEGHFARACQHSDMPTIQEIMESQSSDNPSSLQISSTTSPETGLGGIGRALHVKKTGSHSIISSRSSGSPTPVHTPQHVRKNTKKIKDGPSSSRSSSVHSAPPRMPSQGSHRGLGAIVPMGSEITTAQSSVAEPRVDENMSGEQGVYIQNTQQNLYDQRSLHVQVGVDPMQMIQHVQSVESHAQSVVQEAVAHVHETQRRVENVVHETHAHAQRVVSEAQRESTSVVLQAQSHVAAVEGRANEIIQELNSRHHSELTRAQDVANQVQYQAQACQQESDAKIQNLMAVVESQNQALEIQRVQNAELSARLAALQDEVVMLRNSSIPATPAQDRNGAVNQEELRVVIDSLRREIRQSQNPSMPIQLPVPQRMSIATPPYDTMSACAGYPQPFPGQCGPSKGHRSGPSSTVTPPPIPPPGHSPSGSSSSEEGHRPGGFSGGSPNYPGGSSNGVVHIRIIQVCIALGLGRHRCHPRSVCIAIKHCSP